MKKTTQAFNEENIKYLRSILGDEMVDTFILVLDSSSDRVINSEDDQKSFDTVKKCLEQMEKFGDNHWWHSKDKYVLGFNHDIGYEYGNNSKHEHIGGEILRRNNYKYWKEIYYH